jgi:phasin family protein
MDTTEFTTKIKSAVGEAQVKAKEAFDKGAATFGEYNEFSKGNLEAVVASGKILASGMQSLGTTFVEDSKSALEILTAEVKELASVKSPTDFFKLQAAFLRRNFDTVVATTSKNSEAVLKLASEAAAPISARVNLAVEKVKQTAA